MLLCSNLLGELLTEAERRPAVNIVHGDMEAVDAADVSSVAVIWVRLHNAKYGAPAKANTVRVQSAGGAKIT